MYGTVPDARAAIRLLKLGHDAGPLPSKSLIFFK